MGVGASDAATWSAETLYDFSDDRRPENETEMGSSPAPGAPTLTRRKHAPPKRLRRARVRHLVESNRAQIVSPPRPNNLLQLIRDAQAEEEKRPRSGNRDRCGSAPAPSTSPLESRQLQHRRRYDELKAWKRKSRRGGGVAAQGAERPYFEGALAILWDQLEETMGESNACGVCKRAFQPAAPPPPDSPEMFSMDDLDDVDLGGGGGGGEGSSHHGGTRAVCVRSLVTLILRTPSCGLRLRLNPPPEKQCHVAHTPGAAQSSRLPKRPLSAHILGTSGRVGLGITQKSPTSVSGLGGSLGAAGHGGGGCDGGDFDAHMAEASQPAAGNTVQNLRLRGFGRPQEPKAPRDEMWWRLSAQSVLQDQKVTSLSIRRCVACGGSLEGSEQMKHFLSTMDRITLAQKGKRAGVTAAKQQPGGAGVAGGLRPEMYRSVSSRRPALKRRRSV